MDKQDKIYVVFMIAFIGILVGIPAITNANFEKVIATLGDLTIFLYSSLVATVHNHQVIIHNQEVLIHNQEVIVEAVETHDKNVTHSMKEQLRNDTRTDWENVTLPENVRLELSHLDFKLPSANN